MIRKTYKYIISFLFVVLSVLLLKTVLDIGMLPTKYFNLFSMIIILINIIGITGLVIKKKWTKVVSGLVYVILIGLSVTGTIVGGKINNFLDTSFDNAEDKYEIKYYIVSKNNYLESDLNGKEIFYLSTDTNNEAVLNKLTTTFSSINTPKENVTELLQNDISVIDASQFELITEIDSTIVKSDYHVIYEFTIDVTLTNQAIGIDETENKTEERVAGEFYNIFVGGYDFTNTFMDYNLLISINKTNKEVLLTTIPRDYYITDAKVGKKDKLSDMGSRGIETNMASVANLFGTKIDYYIKINTKSIVNLVNAVGGITYCSDQSYTTSHAMVMDTYDDTQGQKLYVKKGCQRLNGIQALTVARERLAFKSGDNQRQKNCVQILKAVMKEISVTNYANVLNAVSGSYTTTMSKEFVTENAKAYFSDTSWNIKTQSVTGSGGQDYIFFGSTKDYVMYPNYGTVNTAKNRIQQMKYYTLSELGL